MATQTNKLVFELESLILQSRTLTLEDKQLLLNSLSKLSEKQLQDMKAVFNDERQEYEQIAKQELFAWNQFHLALEGITNKTKQRLTNG